ncbi:MAG: leucine-rich repeat domain-containing protein, partial [Candidatus Symbiothrix sp.]|nr:leucine-rich repeat domain-containing protein [Candidatus Symbiothrix sp.]
TLVVTGDAYLTYADCQAIATAFPSAALKTLDLSAAKFENNATPAAVGNLGAFNINADAQGLQVTEVKLPSGLKTIGSRFFRRFRKLTTVNLPESLQSIGEGGFVQCDLLTSLALPAGLQGIGATAFFQCTNLTMTGLPAALNTLGNTAFATTKVAIGAFPEGITKIEHDCFNTNHDTRHSLTMLTIHEGITEIGSKAFARQKSLNNITVNRVSPPTTATDAFDGVTLNAIDLYIPSGSIGNYNNVEPWKYMIIHNNIPNALPSVSSDVVKELYNLWGQKIAQPQRGQIYIAKSVLSSGEIKIEKYIY